MKKSQIISIIAIVLFIIALLIIGGSFKKMNTTTLEEHSFYQYFLGKKFTYDGQLELTRKKDITQLKTKDIEVELDSTPVYYTDVENKVLFPEDMSIIFPMQNGLMYKINHFANIKFDTETCYLEGTQNKALNNAFLYDGQDLYFFLEETNIKVGTEEFKLSPLSYVISRYKDQTEIYQKDIDKYTIIDNKSKEVRASTKNYEINLNTDSIKNENKEQLLIKNKEQLKLYK